MGRRKEVRKAALTATVGMIPSVPSEPTRSTYNGLLENHRTDLGGVRQTSQELEVP